MHARALLLPESLRYGVLPEIKAQSRITGRPHTSEGRYQRREHGESQGAPLF